MSDMPQTLPETQYAVQLVGPSELKLNKEKEVFKPGPLEVLAKVETVGLCFSDLKLLKQFTEHARKSEVIKGISSEVLAGMRSYVPGDKPTVPGHEVVARIVAVGDDVQAHKVGERVLVQADFRNLKTAGSNGAFGYNFEGGLQEFILLDERVAIDQETKERYLMPVAEDLSASAIALVEPWACVEDSYVNVERTTIKAGGSLLVVADSGRLISELDAAFSPDGPPAEISAICAEEAQTIALDSFGVEVKEVNHIDDLPNEGFDDIVYFGNNPRAVEGLSDKLATKGVVCLVLGDESLGRPVNIGVGRIHYGFTRWVGTKTENVADAYAMIPETDEVRDNDRILISGAGGPMGQMHYIRNICSGKKNLSLVGTDLDDARLASLREKASPVADANGVQISVANAKTDKIAEDFTYIGLMVPVPVLLVDAINKAGDGCVINIFAGIPAPVKHEIDLDRIIEKRIFMFGTSGSTMRDMQIVYDKVESNQLDTNISVDAICGMAGATQGIEAVENRTMAGKIMVYPELHEVGLIPLAELKSHYPTVAEKLAKGTWTLAAEKELLKVAAS